MSTLFRLMHVSDLHFGNTLPNPWWTIKNILSHIPGLETHSERVVRELSDSVRSQGIGNPPPIHFIAAGDLTTWGNTVAFQLVFRFLRRQIRVGSRVLVGF